jgi:hypothetical protein
MHSLACHECALFFSTISHLISHSEHHHFILPQSSKSLNDGEMGKLIMVRSIQMPDVGTCNSELLTRLLEWMGPIYAKIVKFRVSWHFYKLQRQSNCAFGVYFQAIQSEDQNVVAAMVRFIGRLWHFVVEDRRLEVRGITWNSSIVNEGVVVRTKFPIESKIHSFRSQFS